MEKENIHEGHRQRMWDKFEEQGLNAFNEHEALEVLLYLIFPRVNTNELAHRLIAKFGSIKGVFTANIRELSEVKGMGKRSSLYINYIGELINSIKYTKTKPEDFSSIEKVSDYCLRQLSNITYEVFSFFLFDSDYRFILRHNIDIHSSDMVEVQVGYILKECVKNNAKYILLAHNHPMDAELSSNSDIVFTRTIGTLLSYVGVNVIDHIIISNGKARSMRRMRIADDIWF